MIALTSSPSQSTRPTLRSLSLRPAIVLFVATSFVAIPSTTTRAFVAVSARNHKNPFGGFSNWHGTSQRQPRLANPTKTKTAATQRLESPSAERNKDPIWGILSTRVIPRLTISSNSDSDSNPNSPKWSVLETAAGAGVHTEWFASKLLEATTAGDNKDINDNGNNEDGDGDGNSRPSQSFVWYPTDPDRESLDSIRARVEERNLGACVAPPQMLALDATSSGDDLTQTLSLPENDPLDLVLSINMIHIAPWEATLGLMRVAGQRLRLHDESNDKGGYLYCYGPYKQDSIVVPSNE